MKRLLAVLLLATLAACATRPETGALAVIDTPATDATRHDLLVVSTRAKSEEPDTYFGAERGSEAHYAAISLSVPKDHTSGRIEWPDSFPGDPETSFTAVKAGYLDDGAAMTRELNARLTDLPKEDRAVFLFVHGYNTLFAEGVYRFTQVVHDSGFKGVPVFFSWASRGALTDYLFDLNSAMIARQALRQTLLDLAKSKTDHIFILAHSMGNQLLVETLLLMTPAERHLVSKKIEQVVLAAPDIDVDLFKAQLRQIGDPEKPLVLLVSRDDRALQLSSLLAGGKQRVGAYEDAEELANLGAIVVDLSEIEGEDGTNHVKFAEIASFGPQLQAVLGQKDFRVFDPNEPTGLSRAGRDLTGFVGATSRIAITLPANIIGGGLATLGRR